MLYPHTLLHPPRHDDDSSSHIRSGQQYCRGCDVRQATLCEIPHRCRGMVNRDSPSDTLGTQWLFLLIRLTTTFTIISFSSVRLSAIIRVKATSVLSVMHLGISLFSAIFLGGRKFCDHRLTFQFFPQCIIDMLCYCLVISTIKLSDLLSIKPHRIFLQLHFKLDVAIVC